MALSQSKPSHNFRLALYMCLWYFNKFFQVGRPLRHHPNLQLPPQIRFQLKTHPDMNMSPTDRHADRIKRLLVV